MSNESGTIELTATVKRLSDKVTANGTAYRSAQLSDGSWCGVWDSGLFDIMRAGLSQPLRITITLSDKVDNKGNPYRNITAAALAGLGAPVGAPAPAAVGQGSAGPAGASAGSRPGDMTGSPESGEPTERSPRPCLGSPFGAYSSADLRALAYESVSRIANGGVLIGDIAGFDRWLSDAEAYIFTGKRVVR